MHVIKTLSALALLATSAMMSPAFAADVFMKTGAPTSQPIGHYDFCQRLPGECNIRSSSIEPVTLTQQTWDMILSVNHSVNSRIRPDTDMNIYGKEEYWAYPVTAGDCEDYALEKRRELHNRGLPLSSLLITVVRKPDGEGHAVLTVRTDRGDFVLDNLRNVVLNWRNSGYTYLKRQSSYHTGRWVTIEQSDNIVVGSVKARK